MATVALFRISCKKAKDRKRTSVMTQMKYCKQEMLVIETTGVLMEVKTVKPWMYSAGRDIKFLTVQLTACSSTFKHDACEKLQKPCSWYMIYVPGF